MACSISLPERIATGRSAFSPASSSQWAAARACREGSLAPLAPTQRQPHGALDVDTGGRQLDAFVELHGDVGAEQELDLDRAFRAELDHGAVEMRAEGYRLLVDLAQFRERHDLETAGIGKDRVRPVHEPVQPAERRDPLGARPQHQVIGVAEHDVGAGGAHGLGR